MSLFYLYLLLFVAGYVGIFFGIVALILKFSHIGAVTETPLLEVILFILISGGMIKFFSQLIVGLLEINTLRDLQNMDCKVEKITQLPNSNVIPFKVK